MKTRITLHCLNIIKFMLIYCYVNKGIVRTNSETFRNTGFLIYLYFISLAYWNNNYVVWHVNSDTVSML